MIGFFTSYLWGWLLAAALVGLAAGWISVVQRGAGLSRAVLQQLIVLLAAVAGLAVVQAIPGRAGYWLDLGLIMLVLYIVGCVIGAMLRGWALSRHMPS